MNAKELADKFKTKIHAAAVERERQSGLAIEHNQERGQDIEHCQARYGEQRFAVSDGVEGTS